MIKKFSVSKVLASLMVMSLCSNLYAGDEKLKLNIKSQNIGPALMELGEKAGVQIMLPQGIGDGDKLAALQGEYTLSGALDKLLSGSGLKYEFLSENAIAIKSTDERNSDKDTSKIKDGKSSKSIEEIVVTATKRGEGTNIQDTAMSISALDSDSIDKKNLVGMEDYLRSLPGVSMQDRGASQNTVVIRGIAADPQSEDPTVGIYFGEVPVTGLGSNGLGDSSGSMDIKMVDIERIEVLRGPQGTLYGSGSMGGTVRVIPASPNLEKVEGKVAARYSQTDGYGSDNTMVQGVINLPLIEDTLAVRAVAYQFQNSGYINNVAASQTPGYLQNGIAVGGVASDIGDVGNDEYTGFRLTTLWQPIEQLDITLAYTSQKIKQYGFPEIDNNLAGDFQQARLKTRPGGTGNEFLGNEVDITNLVIEYDLGWGNVASSSSWMDYDVVNEADESYRPVTNALGYPASYHVLKQPNKVFIQELRLASQFEGPLQFLAGVYYEDAEKSDNSIIDWSGDPDLAPPASLFDSIRDQTNDQLAFFGELSYDITDQLTATVGVRQFDYEINAHQVASLFGNPFIDQLFEANEKGQNYKFGITYKPGDDTLVYGNWAEGFRLGRPQATASALCDANNDGLLDDLGIPAPSSVESDYLENFELGLKTSFADNRVIFNAAIYRINWEGIPVLVSLPSCGGAIFLNAGSSKSEGIEIEVKAQLTEQLQLDFGTSYGKATLTSDAENLGSSGDNLPGSPDYNINLGLEYNFDLAGYAAFFRSDYIYVAEYYHNIAETGEASGGYSQINLKSGIDINQISVDLFVNNLTNADDFTWVETGLVAEGANRVYRMRPRTVGLNIGYRF